MADTERIEEDNNTEHNLQELRLRNQDRIRQFQRKVRSRGTGYHCPNFPLFDRAIEGLQSGLYMFAGEPNHGKTALTMSLLWDFMACEPNKLYLVFFTLDDTVDDIIPKVISMNQDIPISVTSKPVMYENKCDIGDSKTALYEDWLKKSNDGLEGLIELGEKFTVLDGTDISCGEEILERCKDIKALIRTEDRDANIIVAIDSLMDIEWRDKSFKSDKELNDYTAKQIKKWAVEILDCPIFGTLHLRKIEQNRRPTIADVKESGRYAYEASFLGLVHNDVSRNKNSAAICVRNEQDEITPVIELNWAKNKVSSYKGMTYQTFLTNHSLIKECPEAVADRFNKLIYSS
nr:MAG TPA: Helicase REPLICATION [Caudoviricetes sp.]